MLFEQFLKFFLKFLASAIGARKIVALLHRLQNNLPHVLVGALLQKLLHVHPLHGKHAFFLGKWMPKTANFKKKRHDGFFHKNALRSGKAVGVGRKLTHHFGWGNGNVCFLEALPGCSLKQRFARLLVPLGQRKRLLAVDIFHRGKNFALAHHNSHCARFCLWLWAVWV